MNHCSNCSFIILAGGKSSRYGSAKYELRYGNQTFLQALVTKSIRLSFGETIISGLTKEQVPTLDGENLIFHLDELPNRGPLGGLATCLQQASYPTAFVITVDCPSIPEELIRSVVTTHLSNDYDATLLQRGNSVEPLIGMYNCDFHHHITPLITEHSAPVFRALDSISYYSMAHDFHVQNINTPHDYHTLASPLD
ncbi:MAG: molybdenum cofactor guanylyltransferase [Eubacteriales bacterium]